MTREGDTEDEVIQNSKFNSQFNSQFNFEMNTIIFSIGEVTRATSKLKVCPSEHKEEAYAVKSKETPKYEERNYWKRRP